MTEHVFITGISGCVGHYLFDELASDPRYHLHLLVREPNRLGFRPEDHPNVCVVQGDMRDIERHAERVFEMDHIIHVAAAWGEAISYEVNYRLAHRLFAMANPARIRRMIAFSTASVLDAENRLLTAADEHGTDYIRSKYLACKHLDAHPFGDRIVTVFPTLVFGGSETHPYSHLSKGLPDVKPWLALARFLTLDGTLHFIHARDIARIVHHVLVHGSPEEYLVLGNPASSVEGLIEGLCQAFGVRRGRVRIDLTAALGVIGALFRSRMNTWDRFSMRYRHFRYQTVNAETFGLDGDLVSLEAIVRERLSHA